MLNQKDSSCDIKCDQCDHQFASSNGLKTHMENNKKAVERGAGEVGGYRTNIPPNLILF